MGLFGNPADKAYRDAQAASANMLQNGSGVVGQPALAGQIQNVYGQGQGWQRMLRQQALGVGPNPALEQLRQTTEENIRRTQGGIASQRGINPAMAARLGAYSAGDLNAQANQAAAIQRAQQILAAQQLGGQMNLSQQQILQQALAAQNATRQSGVNAQLAAGVATRGQNLNILGGLAGGVGSAFTAGGMGGGSDFGGGYTNGGMGPGIQAPQMIAAGGEVMPDGGYAQGGPVPGYAEGGSADEWWQADPKSQLGQLANAPYAVPPSVQMPSSGGSKGGASLGDLVKLGATIAAFANKGGAIEAPDRVERGPSSMLGRYLAGQTRTSGTQRHVEAMAKLEAGGLVDFRAGGDVPGRAKVAGDSPKNDTVPAMVSPGEVVLPRSVMNAKNAPEAAAEFVRRLQARSGKRKGYEKVAKAKKGMDEGGKVEEQGTLSKWLDAAKSLVRTGGNKVEEGKDFAEKVNTALPEALSARQAVLRKRQQDAEMDRMNAGD